jgi:predicted flap endonuclease-1-like 5' DNA nuclease
MIAPAWILRLDAQTPKLQNVNGRSLRPEASGVSVDHLNQIAGVARVLERKLHQAGVFYFRQIAAAGRSPSPRRRM